MNQSRATTNEIRGHYKRQLNRKVRKYKRLCWLCSALAMVAGILFGFAAGCIISAPSTLEKGINPTDIPVLVSETPYNAGTTYTFTTDVCKEGAAAYVAQRAKYDAPTFTASVDRFLTPEYYEAQYGATHKLSGSEAGIALTFTLLNSAQNMPFDPQQALSIQLQTVDGQIIDGYPLMDAEISGGYNTAILPGQAVTLYKRFDYRPDIRAVIMTRYEDGYAIQENFTLTQ